MFGTKRSSLSYCPDRPQSKISKDDSFSIYESTMQKLKAGSSMIPCNNGDLANRFRPSVDQKECPSTKSRDTGSNTTTTGNSCNTKSDWNMSSCMPTDLTIIGQICSSCSRKCEVSCFNCRRSICSQCVQLCEQCQEYFCSYCSIYNFNKQEDHVYCLECNLV